MDAVKKQFPTTGKSLTDEILEIFITVIVCQFFKLKYAEQSVNWNLVVKKAQGWIKKESEKVGVADLDFEASATTFLKTLNL